MTITSTDAGLAALPAIPSPPSQTRRAWQDVVSGLSYWPLWLRLGWNDILQRYRRSLLGPFWLTASMGVMVLSLGIVYAKLFKSDVADFMPYLCVGLLVWGLIGSIFTEAGALFTGSEQFIKQIRLPFSVYVYRFLWSRLLIFAHNFLVYFGIVLYFRIWTGANGLLAIPGIAIIMLNGFFCSFSIGMVSARFRDVPQILISIFQVVFFVTPVFWKASMLGEHALLVELNPFYHFVEVVRAPLLGEIPSKITYLALAGLTAFNAAIAAACFIRFRARIAYWI